jgi:protein-disulfide isomerase
MEVTNTGTTQHKVSGTPTFFINDELVDLTPGEIWPQVEPALKKAIGG